jgi:hypothetical protein
VLRDGSQTDFLDNSSVPRYAPQRRQFLSPFRSPFILLVYPRGCSFPSLVLEVNFSLINDTWCKFLLTA